MNRKLYAEVLESTRKELKSAFKLEHLDNLSPQPCGPLQSITNRIASRIIQREGVRTAYEICYWHVFELHDWPNWRAAPLEERVDWLKENLSVYGFDPEFSNLIGISDDAEATIFKTVWR